jgi:major membrane immunogen (membrane-anchored lipoprotein)
MMYGKAMVLCAALLLVSCGDGGGSDDSRDNPPSDGNHVWKSQTDMLDKARAIEDTVMEQSARQRQTIDEMAR